MRIYEDLRAVQARLAIVRNVVVALVTGLIVVFWHLQVHRGRYYRELADKNRTRTVAMRAPRGPLVDRQGQILVRNRPSFNVRMRPEQSNDLDASIASLSRTLQIGEARIRERLAKRSAAYRSVLVKADVAMSDVARLSAHRLELPEVNVEVVPLRAYPLANAAAHALGRVGEVTETQLGLTAYKGLTGGDLVGQAGIEAQYNRSLMGRDGFRQLIVNSRGLEVGEAFRQAPQEGPSLTLTLDADLQRTIEGAFAGRTGAAVAIDPTNGEILAMTSTPAYDPNLFSTGLDSAEWRELTRNAENPLLNRVIQGQYAPGSTFKIVVAAAALEQGLITPQKRTLCRGGWNVYGRTFACNRAGGHGYMNVVEALEHSCNVFFYRLGALLDIDVIASYAKRMGLGRATGIDLPHEATGLIPTRAWKHRARGASWYDGETISVSIGQGQTMATPLQLARLAALVANGGKLVQPHLVRAVGDEPAPYQPPVDTGLKPETLETIKQGLIAAVNRNGTGYRARLQRITVAGKTGSAQVVARSRRGGDDREAFRAHGLFVAFAPAERPEIAIAVVVEHGESGGRSAAPIARLGLARYFATRLRTRAGVADD